MISFSVVSPPSATTMEEKDVGWSHGCVCSSLQEGANRAKSLDKALDVTLGSSLFL